jgi:hypothetical protein
MPTQEPEEVEAEFTPNRATRRATIKKKSNRATFDLLRSKGRQQKELVINVPMGDGEAQETTLLFKALGAKEWEDLISKHPPTLDQKADGEPFNTDTFAPALLAQVCVDPAMSLDEWTEIWESPEWNRGEVAMFYGEAVSLCTLGFDVPFKGRA